MLYRYKKETMEFIRVNWITVSLKVIGLFVFSCLVLGVSVITNEKIKEREVMIIMQKKNQFTPDKFITKIKSLNFRFPHIVLAQAKLETHNFTSKMFSENNNLFGMKEAAVRINTSKGTQNQHAFYDSWLESLYDYGLYTSTYLYSIKDENEYYDYLSQSYAEDKQYASKLKKIVEKENLKELFAN